MGIGYMLDSYGWLFKKYPGNFNLLLLSPLAPLFRKKVCRESTMLTEMFLKTWRPHLIYLRRPPDGIPFPPFWFSLTLPFL